MRIVKLGKFEYVGVSKANPCPVCEKYDWCIVSRDGTHAVCQRIHEGGKRTYPNAGTLHVLDGEQYQPIRPIRVTRHTPEAQHPPVNWYALQLQAEAAVDRDAAKMLAESLGVSLRSLVAFGLGRIGTDWSFPMCNARRRITGIRLRTPGGRKFAVKGSKAGVFVPRGGLADGLLLICEGTTDAAAMTDAGFVAIGRHACRGQVDMITEYAAGRDVVIVADAGGPGQDGADQLARSLYHACPAVRIVTPPYARDAREWWQAATPIGIRHTIDAAGELYVPTEQREAAAELLSATDRRRHE